MASAEPPQGRGLEQPLRLGALLVRRGVRHPIARARQVDARTRRGARDGLLDVGHVLLEFPYPLAEGCADLGMRFAPKSTRTMMRATIISPMPKLPNIGKS